ncbi:hypothetical protein [Bradyrhizobium erythrophlei]|jgi:hypothetical protein|uniref:Uncharacterized protein n=1 Tax=Bradyrhizobium erythrophlei TaxID=1437360 RepID=A0A1M7TBJ5_9BRAD|nr:hypothetical protein [Bradyrhizobium erythrophlei]SHN68114.1 hypothetical protein SAMN05444170_1287 [Bradyrhizobium erythrophlei]
MKTRMYGTLLASVGAIVLTVTANESFAASRGGGASAHSTSHRSAAHRFHHHRSQDGFVWGDDGYFYGPTADTPLDGAPLTGEVRNSNASDIPWDWAHRYPPVVTPSGRPYVSSCGAETVTVPDGRGGTGQVNITRCY